MSISGRGDVPNRLWIPALGRLYAPLQTLMWPLVRASFGCFFIPHGCQKLFGWFGGSAARTAQGFRAAGLEPAEFLVQFIGCLELFGGLLLALGLLTRPIALLFAGFLTVATFHVHWSSGYFWTARGFSVPLLLLLLSLAILIRGGGEWSLDRKLGREF